jgi:hypothetical protein
VNPKGRPLDDAVGDRLKLLRADQGRRM